jgi:aspartate racemase
MNGTPPLIGMRPLATVDFQHKLVAATPAARDHDHVLLLVWNVPPIPDRQKALARTGEFVASATVTLMLDLSFLCIFISIMFYATLHA